MSGLPAVVILGSVALRPVRSQEEDVGMGADAVDLRMLLDDTICWRLRRGIHRGDAVDVYARGWTTKVVA